MKKNGIIALCIVLILCAAVILFVTNANKGDVSHVERVIGYSALYSDDLINEACNVVEKKFAEEFNGCTLTELRYDAEVENKFADQIMHYSKEENLELIVLLSTFDTDKNGGDGGFNPNDTYTNWQWHLVRTPDKKSWEIINWGY